MATDTGDQIPEDERFDPSGNNVFDTEDITDGTPVNGCSDGRQNSDEIPPKREVHPDKVSAGNHDQELMILGVTSF
jgi:hypothetical protein